MYDKSLDILEKIYIEVQEIKSELQETKSEVQGVKNRLDSFEVEVNKMSTKIDSIDDKLIELKPLNAKRHIQISYKINKLSTDFTVMKSISGENLTDIAMLKIAK